MPPDTGKSAQLMVLDIAISYRQGRFLTAIRALNFEDAQTRLGERDALLEERHAMLTRSRLADVIKETA